MTSPLKIEGITEMSDSMADDSSSFDLSTWPLTSTPKGRQDDSHEICTADTSSLIEISGQSPSCDSSGDESLIAIQQTASAADVQESHSEKLAAAAPPVALLPMSPPAGFKLVGDNIDKQVSPRFMRVDKQSTSLHYFHTFAVQDRIYLSHVSDSPRSPPTISPKEIAKVLLPTKKDDQMLRMNFATCISRILVTHMPAMKLAYEGAVDWHIPHAHEKEMSKKSTVVCV